MFAQGAPLLVCLAFLLCPFHVAQAADEFLQGDVKIDGSSTVYLISEAMAAAFKKEHPGVNLSVGLSGTGGGFKKFANGETDIQDASRAITPGEAEKCAQHGMRYTALQIAWDGIAVVINQENDWATRMTVRQLKHIWRPDNPARTWKEVDARWPDTRIELYGPGPDSGTFDFFTEEVNGKARATRNDYNASGDPQTIVQGVSRNKHALAYFGVAYFDANKTKLRDVAVAAHGDDFVAVSAKTVLTRQYPLSRPLFVYVNHQALARPAVRDFCLFYLRRTDLVSRVGYIPLNTRQHYAEKQKLNHAIAIAK